MSKKKTEPVAQDTVEPVKRKKVIRGYSPAQVREMTVEKYEFTDKYERIFGKPGVRSIYLLQGGAKSGKSTFSICFAEYLSQWGRVFYVSAEEDVRGDTFQERIISNNINSEKIRCYHITNIETIDAKVKTGGFRFVFIDSIQACNLTYEQFIEMHEKYRKRKIFWVLVSQVGVNVTKFKHLVTAIMEVDKGKLTVASRNVKAGKYSAMSNEQTLF